MDHQTTTLYTTQSLGSTALATNYYSALLFSIELHPCHHIRFVPRNSLAQVRSTRSPTGLRPFRNTRSATPGLSRTISQRDANAAVRARCTLSRAEKRCGAEALAAQLRAGLARALGAEDGCSAVRELPRGARSHREGRGVGV